MLVTHSKSPEKQADIFGRVTYLQVGIVFIPEISIPRPARQCAPFVRWGSIPCPLCMYVALCVGGDLVATLLRVLLVAPTFRHVRWQFLDFIVVVTGFELPGETSDQPRRLDFAILFQLREVLRQGDGDGIFVGALSLSPFIPMRLRYHCLL